MPNNQEEAPTLLFFRETPENFLSHPPLASSLQHLETSFLLIHLGRYPHALVSCVAAVESALKAAFDTDQDRNWNLWELLDKAQKEFPPHADFAPADINEIRKKRNTIIHEGFSPKDDEISAVLLLKTGYRLVEQCYDTFFQFPLKRKGERYGGLLSDLDRHLDISRKVYLKAKDETGLNLTYCFISFAHQIRMGIQHWSMSDWQLKVLQSEEESGWTAWDYKQNQKRKLALEPSWDFDCPVCNEPESFVCKLDEDELDKGKISLKRGVCVHCNLIIPKNCPFLADELCEDQLDEARPKILKEYGIV